MSPPVVTLMQNVTVFGYARSKMTDEELRNMISQTLTCRIDKRYTIMLSLGLVHHLALVLINNNY